MRSYVFLALLCASFAASAQLYRWTDERGRVHVTDTPPPASARDVQRRAASVAPAGSGGAELPYGVQLAAKNHPVTLYTAPDCTPCGEARALLNGRGVPFGEVSVVDEKQAKELKDVVGSLSVPALRVGSSVQRGFEQGAYHSLLDAAGYPRAGILPPRNQAAPRQAPERKPAADDTREASEESSDQASGPYAPR